MCCDFLVCSIGAWLANATIEWLEAVVPGMPFSYVLEKFAAPGIEGVGLIRRECYL